jgi:hypothetical protein
VAYKCRLWSTSCSIFCYEFCSALLCLDPSFSSVGWNSLLIAESVIFWSLYLEAPGSEFSLDFDLLQMLRIYCRRSPWWIPRAKAARAQRRMTRYVPLASPCNSSESGSGATAALHSRNPLCRRREGGMVCPRVRWCL